MEVRKSVASQEVTENSMNFYFTYSYATTILKPRIHGSVELKLISPIVAHLSYTKLEAFGQNLTTV